MRSLMLLPLLILLTACQSTTATNDIAQSEEFDSYVDDNSHIELTKITSTCTQEPLMRCWQSTDGRALVVIEKFDKKSISSYAQQQKQLGFSSDEYKKYFNNVVAVRYAQQSFDKSLYNDSYEYLVNRLSRVTNSKPWDQSGIKNGYFCLLRVEGVFDDQEKILGQKSTYSCRKHYGSLTNTSKKYEDTKLLDDLDSLLFGKPSHNTPLSYIYK